MPIVGTVVLQIKQVIAIINLKSMYPLDNIKSNFDGLFHFMKLDLEVTQFILVVSFQAFKYMYLRSFI